VKLLPMLSSRNRIQFWKSSVGARKSVREAEEMLRVSAGNMIKPNDNGSLCR
jgi:hypothetical protein